MNVADLKIRNLVEYKNQIFTITEIFQNNAKDYFVKIENDIQSISAPADAINPIQITEEWLEEFGFSRTYSSEQRIRYERPEEFIKYDIDLSPKKIVEGLKIYGNSIRCRYIHEFQNIFSCLFGKEAFTRMQYHQ
ncbi:MULTISPECIES: hypothetical protein [Chryseobacterium]|uniref:hypothetical protein n=1 Tax=Chryseobacterium TaxID=59732 RepID=UPI00155256FA|nr:MULTISPECIES: hypothetical protein [unclassified Chryseobacterium]MDC8103623.1 hypothetical protein [Chryseobacterium sp. B21-037]MDQ1803228.1 hypothetical protein [Chryseobacterium sp. CKR4-1]WBV57156.1 hypothetical protein PFY10_01705 [Chryseobacterium daecheongense]